jgi:hypothetical protein
LRFFLAIAFRPATDQSTHCGTERCAAKCAFECVIVIIVTAAAAMIVVITADDTTNRCTDAGAQQDLGDSATAFGAGFSSGIVDRRCYTRLFEGPVVTLVAIAPGLVNRLPAIGQHTNRSEVDRCYADAGAKNEQTCRYESG